ncbi:DUF998 domain-containing protein [Eubacteriales bacterium OttesenSCG-928-N13]|nr:DUF998 domain-containing protein [Eubacteriales bacterium OttesenSCG-928-N13]
MQLGWSRQVAVRGRQLVWRRWAVALGMPGTLVYVFVIFWGQAHWPSYSGMRDFVSYLTSVGSPNGALLHALDTLHNLLVLVCLMEMYRMEQHAPPLVRRGYLLLMWMGVLALMSYGILPLTMYEHFFSPRNLAHFVLTCVVLFCMLLSIVLIGVGHHKAGQMRESRAFITSAIVIAAMCVLTLLSMYVWTDGTGLMQRMMILSVQAFLFLLSLSKCLSLRRI